MTDVRTPAGETPPTLDVSLAATPATDDLRNALQICESATWRPSDDSPTYTEAEADFAAVARLLRQALQKLEAK